MKNRSLNASILYLIGNIFTKAIAFLTIPVFTRLLTVSEYGIVNTYTSWVTIVMVLMTLSLFDSLRIAFADYREDFDSYCASILRLGGVFLIGAMILADIVICLIPSLRSIAWMIFCCMLQAYGIFAISTMSNKYMLEFRYHKRAVYLIFPNAICALVAVSLMLISQENQMELRIVSYALVNLAFAFIALWVTRRSKTNIKYWSFAIRYSLPLVFHGLSLVILSSSDRIMITTLVGAEQSGIYSLVYNLGQVATAVVTALEGIWLPWFIRKLKTDQTQDINNKAAYLIENVSVLMILLMLLAPEVLQIIASEEYWTGKSMIFPIALSCFVIFLYDLAINIELQNKATKQIAVTTLTAAILNVVLNLIFIPFFGAVAAAYTTLISYLCSMLMHYHNARKICPGILPYKKYLKYYVLVILASVFCRIFMDHALLRWITATITICVYGYVMIRKKRLITFQIQM